MKPFILIQGVQLALNTNVCYRAFNFTIMSFILGEAQTYRTDLELFHELGLKTFKTDSQEELFVGEYKLPHYDKANVKISVTCMPAQFWKFEVETDEDYKCVIKTGSGSLSDYWQSVLKVAEGCFVVNAL